MAETDAALPLDPEWGIGDKVLAEIAYGTTLVIAKEQVAAASRRDVRDVTMILRVCQAFPVDHRHPGLTFLHHEAVLALAEPDREGFMARAAGKGWSARELRRQVLRHRVATGQQTMLGDDDPEDRQYVALVRLWNHTGRNAREMFAGSVDDAELGPIAL